ncbi:MAG: hypothetical protein ACRDRT_02020, partial [Pseudonocardiaceae bacterium]
APTRGEWGCTGCWARSAPGYSFCCQSAAPLELSALVWAFAFGYLIWDDVAHAAVFVGAAILIVSGAAIVWSEWTV